MQDFAAIQSKRANVWSCSNVGVAGTGKCHNAIAGCGENAVIPPHSDATRWKTVTAGAMARNEVL